MFAGEQQHEAGRDGVLRVKRWLESTTRFRLPWDVYDAPNQTAGKLLDGSAESYDLAGNLVGEDGKSGPPVLIEVKRYSSATGQLVGLYRRFLARSYSVARQATSADHDPAIEFMWVTWHPFAQSRYMNLWKPAELRAACEEHADYLAGEAFDPDLASVLAERLWLWVVCHRQDEMTMSRAFLGQVRRISTMTEP